MVQPAQSRLGPDVTGMHGASSAAGCFLPESPMCAIFVVVGNVFGQQPFQVTFIEGNDVVQEVAAATAHPALRNTVLPGTFEGSPDWTHL